MAGKGSDPRPFSDRKRYDRNHARLYGEKKVETWNHDCPTKGKNRNLRTDQHCQFTLLFARP